MLLVSNTARKVEEHRCSQHCACHEFHVMNKFVKMMHSKIGPLLVHSFCSSIVQDMPELKMHKANIIYFLYTQCEQVAVRWCFMIRYHEESRILDTALRPYEECQAMSSTTYTR